MRRKLAVVLGALVFGVLAAPAFGADHTSPGTPGEPNCVGQSTAYLAQLGKNFDLGFRGIGGLGRAADLTPAQIHQVVVDFCNS